MSMCHRYESACLYAEGVLESHMLEFRKERDMILACALHARKYLVPDQSKTFVIASLTSPVELYDIRHLVNMGLRLRGLLSGCLLSTIQCLTILNRCQTAKHITLW
jgi:hypothetical protein